MKDTVPGRVNYFLRTLVYAGVVGLLWFGYARVRGLMADHDRVLAERDERIAELGRDVAERDARIEELSNALRLLKVNRRLARLSVLSQGPAVEGGTDVVTTVRFQELAEGGTPVGPPRDFAVPGRVAYVDALVIKFADTFVEQGDALRGASVCLFRRLFGEEQTPNDGFPLDVGTAMPLVYAGDAGGDPALADLWRRFWDYANDAVLAEKAGVRAIHGEAPYIELRPGKVYEVELRASGGLSLQAVP